MAFLALGKAVVVLAIFPFDPQMSNIFQGLGTKWDASYYVAIATTGYRDVSAPYVFSPFYPALIRLVYAVVGNGWVSALLVTNSLSFAFPLLVYKAFDFRTALLAEAFPTYLVFTTVAYSDVIALVLLACSVLFLLKDRIVRSSLGVSGAIFAFPNLAWTLPSFLVGLRDDNRLRRLLFFVFPFLTGLLILLWFKLATGDYFALFRLEAPWRVGLADPVAQAEYLLCLSGKESFTCQAWNAVGIPLPPAYWLVRNILFEVFYMFGAFYLLRTGTKHRKFLCVYCLSVSVPLLFLVGFPALSIPRLLLPAFPAFVSYSALLKERDLRYAYLALNLELAAVVSVIQYFAIFA